MGPRRDTHGKKGEGSTGYRGGKAADFYVPHLDQEACDNGTYYVGVLRVNPRKMTEAYVSVDGVGVDIRIDTEQLRNRSLHGDLVAIELLPEAEWLEFSNMMKGKLNLDLGNEGTESVVEALENLKVGSGSSEALRAVQESLWRPMVNKEEKKEMPRANTCTSSLEKRALSIERQPRGRVVRIIERRHTKELVGGLQANVPALTGLGPQDRLPDSINSLYFVPADTKFPNLYVPRSSFPESLTSAPLTALQQIYVAEISDKWPARSRLPQGVNLRPVGQAGSIEAETLALLKMNSCAHRPFEQDVLDPLREKLSLFGCSTDNNESGEESREWRIPAEEIARRRDLRDVRIFTIDPPNAKDLDDALHITPLERQPGDSQDRYEVGVHIADVSFFIDRGSALDAEARRRATSVYLVQKVIPMLPPILCEQLCSLNPNVDRLAFSCIWQMNADGTLCEDIAPWFGRTVIRSCAKLDYPTAQRMIEGVIPSSLPSGGSKEAYLDSIPESVWESWRRPPAVLPDGRHGHNAWDCALDVVRMHSISSKRRALRLDNGSLVLTSCKLTFKLDPTTGNPAEAGTYVIRESNQLVEEYMLLANYLVAQELILAFGDKAFLRRHGEPDISQMKELQVVTSQLGFTLDISSAKAVQDSLNIITRETSPEVVKILTNMLAKPIPEAQYCRSGDDPAKWQHYALAIPYYTHFTSPIRRYADVMVHRLLERSIAMKGMSETEKQESLGLLNDPAFTKNMDDVAMHCNEMKKASKNAQTRSDRVYLSVYLSADHKGPQQAKGHVTGIGEKSFTVFCPEYGVDDRLFVDNMAYTTNKYDPTTKTLRLTRTAPEPGAPALTGRAAERPDTLTFTGTITVKLLSPVIVRLSSKTSAPVDVQITLVGPDSAASQR